MYKIATQEANEEFARCWQAAGIHLENQAGGQISSWLKANLEPPFLEHLSFRLGNQLFFIRLEDVDEKLERPGSIDGLIRIAQGCQGHACVMPMKKRDTNWRPMIYGWGLLDALSGEIVDPPALISDDLIEMTEWELQDFAVQVVRDDLQQKGKEIMSSQGNPNVDPSLWFVGEHGPEWVVVRACRYPKKKAAKPENLKAIHDYCRHQSERGNFAVVSFANSDDPFDPVAEVNGNFLPLYRGFGVQVSYEGLEKLRLAIE